MKHPFRVLLLLVLTASSSVALAQSANSTDAVTDTVEKAQDYLVKQTPDISSPLVHDPLERSNRAVYKFNLHVDSVVRPVAKFYKTVTPLFVRKGIGNFYSNLDEPLTVVNGVLSGNLKVAGNALLRFVVNSTLGIGGLFDIASAMKIPHRERDFGQVLASWGMKKSPYLVLPLIGPRTVRDSIGLVVDSFSEGNYSNYLDLSARERNLLLVQYVIVLRASLLGVTEVAHTYELQRDGWILLRNHELFPKTAEDLLDTFGDEFDEDFDLLDDDDFSRKTIAVDPRIVALSSQTLSRRLELVSNMTKHIQPESVTQGLIAHKWQSERDDYRDAMQVPPSPHTMSDLESIQFESVAPETQLISVAQA